MKKILTLLLALTVVFCAVSCGPNIMTHDEFMAAEKGEEVTIEAYVQAKQGWYQDQAVVYLQTATGGYYVYSLPCTESEYDELVAGTKVQVTGTKDIYSGMHEINPATSFKIISGDTYIATAVDVTEKLGNEAELIKYQGMLVKLTDMTVTALEYKNQGGDDIYLKLSKGEAQYSLTVEVYLTGTDSDVYAAVGGLVAGDVIDVEGYMQWWNGLDCHVTKVTKK